MTSTLVQEEFAITLKRLVELLELEEEDDHGILRPTTYAFISTLKLVLEAYELMGDSFSPASPCTDEEGRIILTWAHLNPELDLTVVFPASPEYNSYIFYYHSDKDTVEYDVSASKLVDWLQWLKG